MRVFLLAVLTAVLSGPVFVHAQSSPTTGRSVLLSPSDAGELSLHFVVDPGNAAAPIVRANGFVLTPEGIWSRVPVELTFAADGPVTVTVEAVSSAETPVNVSMTSDPDRKIVVRGGIFHISREDAGAPLMLSVQGSDRKIPIPTDR